MFVRHLGTSPKLKQVHDLLLRGEREQATRRFEAISARTLSRDAWAQYAALSRRLRKNEIGARLLHRVVRPGNGRPSSASPSEIAEYAACLTQMGGINEAENLLSGLTAMDYPLVPLLKGILFTARWDYAEAIPHFEEFLKNYPPELYESRIAAVNLAGALIFCERHEAARDLLLRLSDECQSRGENLLLSNCELLLAESEVDQKKFVSAEKRLASSATRINGREGIELFLIQKWQIIILLQTEGPTPLVQRRIAELSAEARRLKSWEGIRDLDYHWAIATDDRPRLQRLYFGTAFLSVRERYKKKLTERGVVIPSFYLFILGEGERRVRLNLNAQEWQDSLYFKSDRIPRRVLTSLLSDFYRPKRLMGLFNDVFPGEVFYPAPHAQSTTDRMRKAIQATRKALRAAEIPLRIIFREGNYRVLSVPGTTVEIALSFESNSASVSSATRRRLQQFRNGFAGAEFEAKTFMEETGVPRRTAFRHLREAVEARWLYRKSQGRTFRYCFTDSHAE